VKEGNPNLQLPYLKELIFKKADLKMIEEHSFEAPELEFVDYGSEIFLNLLTFNNCPKIHKLKFYAEIHPIDLENPIFGCEHNITSLTCTLYFVELYAPTQIDKYLKEVASCFQCLEEFHIISNREVLIKSAEEISHPTLKLFTAKYVPTMTKKTSNESDLVYVYVNSDLF